MNKVLEFPSKIFVQWGAIAQEIVPYLAQRGAKREEIRAVVDRLRAKWEQLECPDTPQTAEVSERMEEGDLYVSRHWRSQSARTLIESAMLDYQRHTLR